MSALSGEMYRTRTVGVAGRGPRANLSRHHRNAARVLPLPVGAWIRVCRPAAMLAQPPTWAGVGAAKAELNHSPTAGLKVSMGSPRSGRGLVLAATRLPLYSWRCH